MRERSAEEALWGIYRNRVGLPGTEAVGFRTEEIGDSCLKSRSAIDCDLHRRHRSIVGRGRILADVGWHDLGEQDGTLAANNVQLRLRSEVDKITGRSEERRVGKECRL